MADYKNTVFLPRTDFPMKAGLGKKEPELLAFWDRIGLFSKLRAQSKGREKFVLHDGPPYANGGWRYFISFKSKSRRIVWHIKRSEGRFQAPIRGRDDKD